MFQLFDLCFRLSISALTAFILLFKPSFVALSWSHSDKVLVIGAAAHMKMTVSFDSFLIDIQTSLYYNTHIPP